MRSRFVVLHLVQFVFWISCLGQVAATDLADLKASAEAGDAVAQDKLAERFTMQANSTQAELWYRKAAEQGYAHSQGRLGNMLLMRSRINYFITAAERAAAGEESVKWATLGANQGDTRAQADLADLCLEGKLVKQDLVEAYKWGALAAKGSSLEPATHMGRTACDNAALKMTPEQAVEAKRRVAAFVPHLPTKAELPEPAWVKLIRLSGMSGTGDSRLVMINSTTFAKGETASVKLTGKSVKVTCLEIRDNSVLVQIDGVPSPRVLSLKQ